MNTLRQDGRRCDVECEVTTVSHRKERYLSAKALLKRNKQNWKGSDTKVQQIEAPSPDAKTQITFVESIATDREEIRRQPNRN
jgi:hypothetical protein